MKSSRSDKMPASRIGAGKTKKPFTSKRKGAPFLRKDDGTGQLNGSIGRGASVVPTVSPLKNAYQAAGTTVRPQIPAKRPRPTLTAAQKRELQANALVNNYIQETRLELKEDQRLDFDKPWPTFVSKMFQSNPQSYGTRIESYVVENFGWTPVAATENLGDARNEHNGEHYEIKATYITSTNRNANFLQIRLTQNLEGYHLFVIDATTPDYETTHYYLTHDEMKREVKNRGSMSHGTKSFTSENKNHEWTIRLPWSDSNETKLHWDNAYRADHDEKFPPTDKIYGFVN